MSEPENESVFAEFAEPKLDPMAAFKARQARSKETRKRYWGAIFTTILGGIPGAVLGVTIVAGYEKTLPSLIGSLLGALGGGMFGSAIGGFAMMNSFARGQGGQTTNAAKAERSWNLAASTFQVWCIVGIVLGSGSGAGYGVLEKGQDKTSVLTWGIGGAWTGAAIAFGVPRFIIPRLKRGSAPEVLQLHKE